ncbi:MAG: hypothetical protein Q8K28_03065 [Hoeflea sp.]|uniref:hypothetical protein n=1 Tax=Hoeflea sp. TaxID=1940281 RepID=UPI00272F74A9|nr:hypothetical protein [Hoeflea sp.]MDP2118862.1 hypothetical protein [Hoeflea sp.]
MTSEKRMRIEAKAYPLTPKGYDEIEAWLEAEEKHIQEGAPPPDPLPILQGWPHDPAKLSGDCIGLLIRYGDGPNADLPGQSARLFDPAIVAFMRIALAFRGSMSHEKVREKKDAEGVAIEERGQYYPKMQLGRPGAYTNMKVGRVVLDTPGNRHARMGAAGHYDFRRRNLRTGTKARPEYKPGEQGRNVALRAALRGYDYHHQKHKPLVSRERYERLMRLALRLADEREALRSNTLV